MANVRRRLGRLKQRCAPPLSPISIVCVDAEGRVLEQDSEALRPWVGRHHSELPHPVTVLGGVDPLRVLGLIKEGEPSPNDEALARKRLPQ